MEAFRPGMIHPTRANDFILEPKPLEETRTTTRIDSLRSLLSGRQIPNTTRLPSLPIKPAPIVVALPPFTSMTREDAIHRIIYDLKVGADQTNALHPITITEMDETYRLEGSAENLTSQVEKAGKENKIRIQNDFMETIKSSKIDSSRWYKIKFNFKDLTSADKIFRLLETAKTENPQFFATDSFDELSELLEIKQRGCKEILKEMLDKAERNGRITKEQHFRNKFFKEIAIGMHIESILRIRGFTEEEITAGLKVFDANFISPTTSAKPGHGIVNLGATCYLNTALQCLKVTPGLREELQLLANGSKDPYQIAKQLKAILDALDSRHGAEANYISSETMKLFFESCFSAGWGNEPEFAGTSKERGAQVQMESDRFIQWLRQYIGTGYKPLEMVRHNLAEDTQAKYTDFEVRNFMPCIKKISDVMQYLQDLETLKNHYKELIAFNTSAPADKKKRISDEKIRLFLCDHGFSEHESNRMCNLIQKRESLNTTEMNLIEAQQQQAQYDEAYLLLHLIMDVIHGRHFDERLIKLFLIHTKRYDISDITFAYKYFEEKRKPHEIRSSSSFEVNPADLIQWNCQEYNEEKKQELHNYQTNAAPFFFQTLKRNATQTTGGGSSSSEKNKTAIDFTKPIVRDICNEAGEKIGSVTYEAVFVIIHSGESIERGHYYSLAKMDNGEWHRYNDSIVEAVDLSNPHISLPYKQNASSILWQKK